MAPRSSSRCGGFGSWRMLLCMDFHRVYSILSIQTFLQRQKIVVALHEKFVPQDMVAKIELRGALNSVAMKKKDDPGTLFEQISGLQN
eukprot:1148581-Ditylum_brightwellii.AAC.1